ncbi:MAG: GTP-binding protein [Candidatus Helarchaeota archaeon]|nr:GTP-binding protein [Candidatus Helarchaeota archaeon]
MEKNLIIGIIYSRFNEKIGPEAFSWLPTNLDIQIKNLVSLKSINILSGEKGRIPQTLAFIPFPSLNLKSIVKVMEIKDKSHRGGVFDASLTVLFEEANDLIFYKYITNFEEIFEEYANKIINIEERKADKELINESLKIFQKKLTDILTDLYNAEIEAKDQVAFREIDKKEEAKALRFKVIVVGDPSVGKTSIVLRFTDRAFRRTYIPTIGVNISEKIINYKDAKIEFVIWDIAGQSKFSIMRKHFYTGANIQFLVFDLTSPKSFENILNWYKDIKKNLKNNMRAILLANKNDLIERRKINQKEIKKLANELNLEYIETSALTGENVDQAFYKMGEILYAEEEEEEKTS